MEVILPGFLVFAATTDPLKTSVHEFNESRSHAVRVNAISRAINLDEFDASRATNYIVPAGGWANNSLVPRVPRRRGAHRVVSARMLEADDHIAGFLA
jgi:hypothetical protein